MKKDESTRIMQRLIRSLLPAQALAVGLPAINMLLDSLIIGNFLGQVALAVIGFVGPINQCISAVSSAMSAGMQLVCGRFLGKGDKKGLHSVFTGTIIMCFLFGGIFTAIMEIMPDALANLLGATGENGAMAAAYLRGLGIGVTFTFLSACGIMFLQSEHASSVSIIAVIVMLIVNVGGNLLNALCLKWGMFGVGFFMSMGNIAASAVSIGYILLRSEMFKFSPRSLRTDVMWDILKTGSPKAMQFTCIALRDRIVNHYIFMLGGNTAMAALAIASSVKCAVGSVIQSGYSGSGRMVAGVLIGQRDSSSLRDLPKVMAKIGLPLFVAGYALVFFLARPMALLLGADVENIAVYVSVIRLYNLWYLTDAFYDPPLAIYHAMGNMKMTMLAEICSNFLFTALICAIFGSWSSVNTILCLFSTVQIYTCIVFAVVFTKKAHRLPRSPLELCYVPSTLSAPRENRFKATLNTVESVVEASERAKLFCIGRGMPELTASCCALCIEEMAVDTIQNRFEKIGSTIDLRMIYEDGHITMILRDDCTRFDPMEWLKLCTPEDATRSIGIRMVANMAQKMDYINVLGMNVLTIRV